MRLSVGIFDPKTGCAGGAGELLVAHSELDSLAFDCNFDELWLRIFSAALRDLHDGVIATARRDDGDAHAFQVTRSFADSEILVNTGDVCRRLRDAMRERA